MSETDQARQRFLAALELHELDDPDAEVGPNTMEVLRLKVMAKLDAEGFNHVASVVERAKRLAVEKGGTT